MSYIYHENKERNREIEEELELCWLLYEYFEELFTQKQLDAAISSADISFDESRKFLLALAEERVIKVNADGPAPFYGHEKERLANNAKTKLALAELAIDEGYDILTNSVIKGNEIDSRIDTYMEKPHIKSKITKQKLFEDWRKDYE